MRAAVLVLILLLPASAAFATDAKSSPFRSSLDLDQDGVDDALAPLVGTSARATVLLAYAAAPTDAQRSAAEAAGARVLYAPHHFPILVVEAPAARIPALADAPGVLLVETNDVIRPLLKESVPLVGAPQAWQRYGASGKGIVAAVLDDGAFEQHPDLRPKLVANYDASTASAPLARPSQVSVLAPAGEEGHATHVTGTIVGEGRESGGVYKGVAPAARFVNVKVFAGPNQTTSDIVLRGLDWTLTNKDRLGIRVAVMSLGGRPSDGTDALSRAVDIAVDKGLVVVAAAGNAGPGPQTITSPGAAEKAITVAAVDKQRKIASFSSRGPTLDERLKPDIAAPGVAIVSTVPPVSTGAVNHFVTGGRSPYYGPLSGTSMAAPHVAGAVALVLEADPELTPPEVKRILLATAQDIGPVGTDNETGYGFLNVAAAVQVTKDPGLLDSPTYRSRLAAIPEPPPEAILDRLQYEAQSMIRSPTLLTYVMAGVALLALAAIGVAIVRR